MAFTSYITDDSRVEQIFFHRPDIYRPFAQANDVVMRGPSDLSVKERELIGALSSALAGCQYCAGIHAETARLFGVEPGLLEQLIGNFETAPLGSKQRPLLAFIRKLVLTPQRMVQSDADAVYQAGWSEDALHDAIAVSALFAFMNRLVMGHGISADESQFQKRGKRHFETGYIVPD